jgi:hypothetical protein
MTRHATDNTIRRRKKKRFAYWITKAIIQAQAQNTIAFRRQQKLRERTYYVTGTLSCFGLKRSQQSRSYHKFSLISTIQLVSFDKGYCNSIPLPYGRRKHTFHCHSLLPSSAPIRNTYQTKSLVFYVNVCKHK